MKWHMPTLWARASSSRGTHLRERLTAVRDLFTDLGSVFVQIGGENSHQIPVLMDEAFGEGYHVGTISFSITKAKQGRLALKVINHLGDEVMKVFKVSYERVLKLNRGADAPTGNGPNR